MQHDQPSNNSNMGVYNDKEVTTMDLHTLMTVGILGLTSGGFGGEAPIPIGAGVDAPTYCNFNAPVVWSQPTEPQASGAPAGFKIPIFNPTDFPFVIINPDDGRDKGAGWREAKANLPFYKIVIPESVTSWKCRITIGMPIRSSTRGNISAIMAATMSSVVTNRVMLGMDFKLPQGIFCFKFRAGVEAAFPIVYPDLGERVGL
jgi:hypothetical protein